VFKPEGYDPIRDKREIRVKYQGNIFKAKYWAGKEPGVDPGWELYDELYDLSSQAPTGQAKIIAYIPAWKKQDGFNYARDEMYRYITHGIIAFLMFDENNLGEFTSQSLNDVNVIIADVVTTGHRNGVKVSIALGGATDYGFLNLMTSVGNNPGNPLLDLAVQNVVNFVQSKNLDGVDLDLECWWDKNGNPRNDQGGRAEGAETHPAGYGLIVFAIKLREAMPNKLVSAAFFASSWYGNNYELIEYVDWIGVMTYDLTGSWNNSPVGPHTALYKIRDQKAYQEEQQGSWPLPNSESQSSDPMMDNPIQSVEEALWYWTNPFYVNWQGAGQRMPRSKFVGGVPLYGYDFAYGKDPDELSGQVPPRYKTIKYKDILTQFPEASTAGNGNIKVSGSTPRPPFISASGNYSYAHNIYFETPDTAIAKLNFLKDVGAQGVIIWELTTDVWEEGKSIVKALYKNSGNLQKLVSAEELNEGSLDVVSLPRAKFSEFEQYENGFHPSVAINSELIVEVHQGLDNHDLSYRVGKVGDDLKIQWLHTGNNYTQGFKPSVAINNDGVVVEVHEGLDNHDLSYRVGKVSVANPEIQWLHIGDRYTTGFFPSVAINNDGIVVEVHEGEDNHDLSYRVGKVSVANPEIQWLHIGDRYTTGFNPSVAINNSGIVVEIHSGEDNHDLSYRVGKVSVANPKIDWEPSDNNGNNNYDHGINVSVAINDDGIVVEVHQSEHILSITTWYHLGRISGGKINWVQNESIKSGELPLARPSVACNVNIAIQVSERPFPPMIIPPIPILRPPELYYSVLPHLKYQFSDRRNWLSAIPDLTLIGDINLPGTHDSAAINLKIYTPYACQDRSITDQLNGGIRVLDVRLKVKKSGSQYEFATCHGDIKGPFEGLNEYQSFPSLLDECKNFLGRNSTEVVIMSLKVDDWSTYHGDSTNVFNALNTLLSNYPTSFSKDMPSLGEVRGKIFLYNRITDNLQFGVPISWSDNTSGSYANESLNRSYKVYVQDQYKDLPSWGANEEKLKLVTEAFTKKEPNEMVLNFASATWYVIKGVYITDDLLKYFRKKSTQNRLTKFGWTMFDYPFTTNLIIGTDNGSVDIVGLVISSNFNYSGFEKYVIHEHDEL
jgi:GH18 family chitinase